MAKNNNKKKKKIFIALGVAVILVIVVLANILRKPKDALGVQIAEVKKGTLIQTVSASGKVRPVVEVKISAKVSGNITDMRVEEGDSIHKGDLLLKLDRERYSAAVERSQSGLKSAQSSLWKAKAEFERFKELYNKNLASQAEMQTAEASFRLAESEVEQAEAMLKEAKDDLSKTEIYSPMTGVVTLLNKEKGEMVLGASFQEDVIMVISDLSQMEVEVDADENDVVSIKVGDPVKIEIDAFSDTTFKGKVTRIANTGITKGLGTQEEVTNFKVEVGILDKIAGIRPGMSATVDIQVEKHDSTLYIPIQCVSMRYPKEEATKEDSIKKNDKKGMKDKKGKKPKSSRNNPNPNEMKNKNEEKMIEVVFMVMEGDTARMIPVKTGITSDTDIEVLSGLKEGERVVSGPYRLLATKIQDGDLVREDLTIKETRETEEERQPSGMD